MKSEFAAFVLASLLLGYPDKNFSQYSKMLLKEEKTLDPLLHKELLSLLSSEKKQEKLRGDYIDLFDINRSFNPAYETAYSKDPFSKTKELSDLSGFYRAFGFELGGKEMLKEMGDHISVELEFYALLLMKQKVLEEQKNKEGSEIVLDARKKFLKDHLGRFVTSLSKQESIKNHPFYSMVFKWCEKLVSSECKNYGIVPEPLPFIQTSQKTEEVNCSESRHCER